MGAQEGPPDVHSKTPKNCANESESGSANSVDHQLHVSWVRIGCDAVAQIKDMWTMPQRANDVLSLAHQIVAARHHMARGQIALHAAAWLHMFGDPVG